MNINLLLEKFDELTDSEALLVSFKEFHSILVDNVDIIRVDDVAIHFKSTAGNITVNVDEVNGFQVLEKSQVVMMLLSKICGD